jgi:hypothetical protein
VAAFGDDLRQLRVGRRVVRGRLRDDGGDDRVTGRGRGFAAIRLSRSRPEVANSAVAVLWSLRFMVGVLLWVIGVVGNYNTTIPRSTTNRPN